MKVKLLSHVRVFGAQWTVAHPTPLSMGFSRQEYRSGLPFPSPEDLPNPRIEPRSPALQADALASEPPVPGSGTVLISFLFSLFDFSDFHYSVSKFTHLFLCIACSPVDNFSYCIFSALLDSFYILHVFLTSVFKPFFS